MPGTTPAYGLPYQTNDDPPNGPTLGQDLAEAVEAEIVRIDGELTTTDGVLTAIDSAWTSGTPVWSQSGGSILTIGNGTLAMRHRRVGSSTSKTVHLRLDLVRGSTSNVGTAAYAWSLPAGWPAPLNFRFTGTGAVFTAAGQYPCMAIGIGTNQFVLAYTQTTVRVANLNPAGGAWATGDAIVADLTYETS